MLNLKLKGFFDDRPRAMSPDDIQALYRWLSIPRYLTTVVSAAAIAIFWSLQKVTFDPRPILFVLVPLFVILSALTDMLIRRNVHPYAMLHAQLLLDMLAVTAAILLTGGEDSPFTLLYILVIISASLLSIRTLIAFSAMTAALFWAVDYLSMPTIISGLHRNVTIVAGHDPIAVVMFCLIVALIAFQSSYYVSRIRQKDDEVLKLKDEFLFRTIHDLRSPSTAMRYIVEKYRHDPIITAQPGVEADFAVIENALGRMTILIEDLLKIA